MTAKSLYAVNARVGEAKKWSGGWFRFHTTGDLAYAKRMLARAQVAYAHWDRLSVNLVRYSNPKLLRSHGRLP